MFITAKILMKTKLDNACCRRAIRNNRGARNGKNVIIWKNFQLKIKCKANQINFTANHSLEKDDE